MHALKVFFCAREFGQLILMVIHRQLPGRSLEGSLGRLEAVGR